MTQYMGATQPGQRRQPGPNLRRTSRRAGLAQEALLLAALLFAVGLISGAGIGLALPDVAMALGLKKEGPSLSVPLAPGPQVASADILPLPRVIEPANAVEPAFLIAEPLRHRKGDLGGLRFAGIAGGPAQSLAEPSPVEEPAEQQIAAVFEDRLPEGELVTGSVTKTASEPAAPPVEEHQVAALAPPAKEAIAEPAPLLGPDAPQISLILDDLGLNAAAARRAMNLPKPVTLSFLPYGEATSRLAAEAREAGHEVMLHLPMEPLGDEDPGPKALTSGMSPAEIEETVRYNLAAFSGYSGVNNHMGSRFTEDVRALIPVMRVLREKGLFFVDSLTSERSRAGEVGRMAGVPGTARDVFLDHAEGPDHLLHQLQLLEEKARKEGRAVAIAHPHDLTLEMLDVWVRSLAAKGIRLVPASEIIAQNAARG